MQPRCQRNLLQAVSRNVHGRHGCSDPSRDQTVLLSTIGQGQRHYNVRHLEAAERNAAN